MLMLLSVHVTGILFLVWFNNFALTMGSIGVTHSYSSRPFLCTLVLDRNKFHNIPHMMGLPDHVPLLWQTLSVTIRFSSYPLSSSQTKQAVEPAVMPL